MIAIYLENYQLVYRGEENIPSVLCDGWQQFSTMRNVTKVILRRNGYPEEARAKVIDSFIYEIKT